MRRHLILGICAFAPLCQADEPDSPGFHFFAVPSPSDTCVAVQTVRPWRADSVRYSQYGRLQIFRSDTGAELWRIEGVLASQDEVFPSDDLEHLVIVRSFVPLPAIDTAPVVLFYSKGRLLRSHTLKELEFDMKKLKKSVSHGDFAEVRRPEGTWSWERVLGTKAAASRTSSYKPNPRWTSAGFWLRTLDGQLIVFDPKTGALLGAKRSSDQTEKKGEQGTASDSDKPAN